MKAAFLDRGLREAHHAAPGSPAALAAWLDVALDRVTDAAAAERFAAACPVAGLPTSAYRHRLLEAHGAVLLAGIRFLGGDVARPFVDLLAWDRPVDDWDAAVRRTLAAFVAFRPFAARLRWPGDARPPTAWARRDQWLVANRLGDLRSRPPPPRALDVRPAEDLSFLRAYEAAFAAWRATAGPRGAEVCPSSEEDLRACLERGAVVCARHEGRWAGVAAAAPGAERLFDGLCMHEELLDAPLRGRGLAPSLQRHLIDRVPAPDDAMLWGTIHATNAPSLATALRCGRRIVETLWFVRAG